MVGSLFLGLIADFPLVDWNMLSMAIIQLAGAFILAIIVIYVLLKFLPRSDIFRRLILQTNIDEQSGYTSEFDVKKLMRKKGKALTDLRPSGTALIGTKRIDVVTAGEYINKGTKVVVTDEEGSKVVVEKIK